MGYMTIDGRKVEFTDEPNVLSVIRNADIDIPTLCYHSELSSHQIQFTSILGISWSKNQRFLWFPCLDQERDQLGRTISDDYMFR